MERTIAASQTSGSGKRVQDYIDETPIWPDGTPVGRAPMTTMQLRIWWLAAFGKFFEGLVVFMTAVALPLIAVEFNMTAAQHGIVGAASLAGILVGELALGGLSDTFGRKFMFVVEMIIFMIFLILLAASPSYIWLVIVLFGVGLALGCDYPTAHLIISESIPSASRGRLVLGAFGSQYTGTAQTALIFAGFMLFNFMTNMGPNSQTYLLAGEVFPTHVRGKGAGFAAAFGKIGAVATAFLFPILLSDIGTTKLLYVLAGTSVLGAVVTWLFRIETTGMDLDRMHEHKA